LARRVFNAQVKFPSKSDWVSQAKKYLLDCEINLTDSEIAMKSSYQFKSLLRKKINQKSIDYLTGQQMRHSKSQFLHQNESMKEYLKTDTLSTKQKQMLFKMRS
jgi:acyl-CoA hydrolase